eukprot:7355815-Prymnesium_polylepis.1
MCIRDSLAPHHGQLRGHGRARPAQRPAARARHVDHEPRDRHPRHVQPRLLPAEGRAGRVGAAARAGPVVGRLRDPRRPRAARVGPLDARRAAAADCARLARGDAVAADRAVLLLGRAHAAARQEAEGQGERRHPRRRQAAGRGRRHLWRRRLPLEPRRPLVVAGRRQGGERRDGARLLARVGPPVRALPADHDAVGRREDHAPRQVLAAQELPLAQPDRLPADDGARGGLRLRAGAVPVAH